ncbi:MAG: hypothetical protein JXR97_01815 [Planctomycetes bacterium]|nr:hypothetical protein [Planctomycetota bacterium]
MFAKRLFFMAGVIALMGIFAFIFGRGAPLSDQPELPEITSESEDGFVDLVFKVVDSNIQNDGNGWVEAYGVNEGRRVGLRVELIGPWKEGIIGADIQTFQGQIRYISVGEATDLLVQDMQKLYGSTIQADKMKSDGVLFTGITLGGNPAHTEIGSLKIKLFVESEDEDRYAELYTNIDITGKRLEIREKDPDYRDPVIRALAGM